MECSNVLRKFYGSGALSRHRLCPAEIILAPNGPIPVGKSTWWAGVKSGRFPKPEKLGDRITVWRAEDIRKLFEQGDA
jgi:prophage regulatory protein